MTYTCPMHPEVKSEKEGFCPKCGMRLEPGNQLKGELSSHEEAHKSFLSTYQPLIVILGLIALGTFAFAWKDTQSGTFAWQNVKTNFMGGFFFAFAGFKLLDLKGFAQGYSTYDILARKFMLYGYMYPFIELGLAVCYLMRFHLTQVSILTVVIMGFSGLGVLQTLSSGRKFQCACLGTFIKVPLTSVTLFEDFGMAIMAILPF